MSKKIGFWPVFSLVTGSQIGTGIFTLPTSLAPYGILSLGGWIIAGGGAVMLALVFAQLCSKFPRTGGPHIYVEEAFGTKVSFFTGWSYWIISWVGMPSLIIASIGYLTPLIGYHSPTVYLGLEIGLLMIISYINLRGVRIAGTVEFLLTNLKIIPLLILPITALFFFDIHNFTYRETASHITTQQALSHVTLLSFWAFVGLESATTPADSVENPAVTIPKAVVLGTIFVAILYFINTLGIMGAIPGNDLMHYEAPYVDLAQKVFGGNWHIGVSLIASIICMGTINAWILASGQIALGLAESGFIPRFLAKKNLHGAPFGSLIISFLGTTSILILTSNKNLCNQITAIIDFSVVAFLFLYTICTLAFLKILLKQYSRLLYLQFIYGVLALGFCLWAISSSSLQNILVLCSITLTGIPVYILQRKNILLPTQPHIKKD